jgi:putative ABC transport system substrate-binding protein
MWTNENRAKYNRDHPVQLPTKYDLVRRPVGVIAGLGGSAPALAAKAATATISIVFAAPQNPVELGLVDSLNRPGGNVTGIVGDNDELTAKRVERLHELVHDATVIGVLVNSGVPTAVESTLRSAQVAANALGVQLHVLKRPQANGNLMRPFRSSRNSELEPF